MNVYRTALRLRGAALVAGFTDLADAAESVVATTCPGSFDEAFKTALGPRPPCQRAGGPLMGEVHA